MEGYWWKCRYLVKENDADYSSKREEECRLFHRPCMHSECLFMHLELRISQLEDYVMRMRGDENDINREPT